MEKLYNYFKNLDSKDRLSQAFLIGNVCFFDVKQELYKIFSEFLFKNSNIENNPDIYLLGNNDSSISKDDIKVLLNNISTTSQFNNIKVYVIDGCEKLSDSACNTLLKTIEEPQIGIYAFLLTNNMDDVIPTIASRCQKIFISSGNNATNENEFEEISNEIINSIERYGIKTIANNNDIYNLIVDRNSFSLILNNILKKYNDALNIIINEQKCDNIINENNNIETISNKILIINDNINRLNNYLNKNLSIDRFIIEMWRCNK